MRFDDTEVVALLGALSEAKGPSGFEDEVLDVVRRFCTGWARVEENTLRDGLITLGSFTGEKPVLMLDAHGDEVGGMVRAIRSNGTMSFVELGGFSPNVLAGQDVWVRATDGSWVRGVIGVKPPHFWSEAERASGKAPLVLDVGATSREDAVGRFHMGMGEPFVPATSFSFDARTGVALGKAFDCRAGVCAMLLTLRELSGKGDLPFDVVASVSAQEEVGERGVAAAVRHFSPSVAFMFEGCPADDTFSAPDEVQAALRQGPMLRYFDRCMITNPRYQRFVLQVAAEAGLPAQTSVRVGGGTDGGPTHLLDVPCVVAGVPCRHVHAGTAICALEDVKATAELAVTVARRLTPEVVAGF
ncbi:M42 family metallopeptidase [Olsenella profusa]|uniref:M20/M25/M40 family metallo-hydrolase n=1 Tax=Olsenella profusa TaxID=138595 RepID=A0ABS2EZ70_9ACTN|nr:M20/M25/M40 family metallo-hydrolase [Olsenella profusa]MBM6773990.1 M20/M25/M40 family metallo-hydrolase [Olsenella profusa]